MNEKRIGVFDSGFGGLDVFREIVRALPQYDYVYLADTARAPYGSLEPAAVHLYTIQAIDFLFDNGCELVIVACNTASSDALHDIQIEKIQGTHENARILGVLIPAAEEAASLTRNNRIGVIGTVGTVTSNSFPREIHKLNSELQVFQNACPLLVPLVEAGEHDPAVVRPLLETYLSPLIEKEIDTLILGCTHYAILAEPIREIVGPKVTVVSQSEIVPGKLTTYLMLHPELRARLGTSGSRRFCTTDPTDRFETLGSALFGSTFNAEHVTLEA